MRITVSCCTDIITVTFNLVLYLGTRWCNKEYQRAPFTNHTTYSSKMSLLSIYVNLTLLPFYLLHMFCLRLIPALNFHPVFYDVIWFLYQIVGSKWGGGRGVLWGCVQLDIVINVAE